MVKAPLTIFTAFFILRGVAPKCVQTETPGRDSFRRVVLHRKEVSTMKIKGKLVGCNHEMLRTPTGVRIRDEFFFVDEAHDGATYAIEFREYDDHATAAVRNLREDEAVPFTETAQ